MRGLRSEGERFSINDESGSTRVEGLAVFTEHAGQVFQLVGLVQAGRGGTHGSALSASLDSFAVLTDSSKLNVEPLRLDTFKVARGSRFDRIPEITSSVLPLAELGLLNRLDANDEVRAGTLLKTVRGKLPGR
jgi:predicted Zn-dependent protease